MKEWNRNESELIPLGQILWEVWEADLLSWAA